MVSRRAWGTLRPPTVAAAAAYEGPGDVVTTGWIGWWGFRAFNAAARGVLPVCRIIQTVDLGELDIGTDATTGAFDVDAYDAFAALGTGGAVQVISMYDQSGRGVHVTHAGLNLDFAELAPFPAVNQNTFGGGAAGANFSQPFTFVGVGQHIDSAGQAALLECGGGPQMGFDVSGNPDVAYLYALAVLDEAAVDDAPHALIGVFAGASSILSVDGVEGSPGAGGAATIGTSDTFLFGDAGGFSFEAGAVESDISGDRAALAANMMAYYGIS